MGHMFNRNASNSTKNIFIRWLQMDLHTTVLRRLKKWRLIVRRRKHFDSQLIFNQKIENFPTMRLVHELMQAKVILFVSKYQNERKLSLMI